MHHNLLRGGAAGALALSLVLAACGSSSDDTATTGGSSATTDGSTADTEDTAAATTAKATTASTASTASTAGGGASTSAAAGAGQAVDLKEWSITIEGDVKAGAATFALSNTGENPHALSIVKGKSYESLPLVAENGAVDVDKLPAGALIGESERVEKGGTGTLSVTLEKGDYVFFCPIAFGPNSHAKAGQVLSVTVS